MGKVIIPNGAVGEDAVYKEQAIREYSGNPFIEALPPIYAPDEVVEKLAVYPYYSEEERNLDAHYRIHLTQKLFKCFQPLPLHLDLESRISRVIRQGYLMRNPINREYVMSLRDGYKAIHSYDINFSQEFRSQACGFTIIGVSGMGKSVSINRVLSLYPQIIVHSKYNGQGFSFYQLVWLKVDCPFDGSVKGLCIDFFYKVDQLTGTDFYKKVANSKKPVDYMLTLMCQVVRNTGLGLLIIDEVQHLCGARGFGDERMLNFFVTLVNAVGVPIILIGTPKAMSILQSEFRQARRGSGQGDMVWERLQYDGNFEILLDSLWQYQWTRKESILTKSMQESLYEESQGIIDIICKIIVMAQTIAISTGQEQVNEKLIRQVVREHFQLVRPALSALKSGNIREIAKYSDICTAEVNYDRLVNQEKLTIEMARRIRAIKEQRVKMEKENMTSRMELALGKLVELGIEVQKARKAVEEVLEVEGNNIDENKLVIKAVQILSGNKTKKKSKVKTSPKSEDDIRYIVDEGRDQGQAAYDALKDKGYIKGETNDALFKEVQTT